MGNTMGNNQSSNLCIPLGLCNVSLSNKGKKRNHLTEGKSVFPFHTCTFLYELTVVFDLKLLNSITFV